MTNGAHVLAMQWCSVCLERRRRGRYRCRMVDGGKYGWPNERLARDGFYNGAPYVFAFFCFSSNNCFGAIKLIYQKHHVVPLRHFQWDIFELFISDCVVFVWKQFNFNYKISQFAFEHLVHEQTVQLLNYIKTLLLKIGKLSPSVFFFFTFVWSSN